MMKHKSLFWPAILAVIIAGGFVYALNNQPGPWDSYNTGAAVKDALDEDINAEDINAADIMSVDNMEPALAQEFALIKANLAATGKTMTDAEIIDTLKRRQTIFAEAERLDISVSLDEARQYLEDMFTLINDNLDSESEAERTSAGQTMALMQQYMDGLDMTQQEYIELAAPLVQKILSGNALLQYFRSTLDEETAADKDKLTELYNEYVDGLMTDK